MKECTKCGEVKPLEAYSKSRWADGYISQCKPCRNKYANDRYKEDPTRMRANELKSRYGITLEDYDLMVKDQDGQCKICKVPQSALTKRMAVDHCHDTGIVRGLLCDCCNRGLGFFKDSPSLLNKAAEYLENGYE